MVAYGSANQRTLNPASMNLFEKVLGQWFPLRCKTAPLTRPVPYLHRLDDPLVVEYFDLQIRSRDPAAAFDKAKLLLKRHPDDPYVHSLYLNSAARANDTSEVARRWDQWKPDTQNPDDPCLAYEYRQVGQWLRARQLSAAGRNAYDFCLRTFGDQVDLPTRLRLFPTVFDMEAYMPDRLSGIGTTGQSHFLSMHITAKVAQVVATLEMLEGKRTESLALLGAVFRLGQLMTECGYGIDGLIGVELKRLASKGMEIYALNCCDNEADFRELWEMLERLEKRQKPFDARDLIRNERDFRDIIPGGYYLHDSLGRGRRAGAADAEFELLRMATAAKYRLVTQGDFPTSSSGFAPLLSQGPPNDPFADGPLRFVLTTGPLICYSIGPDKKDNRATIEYDPMNRTTSAGDISVKVPRVRQYPFARGGVRAASVEDLLRQFPNGLPPDPFATTRGRGLGTTTTAEGDVCIYSYGPNEDEPAPSQPHVVEVQYDPTNGVTSAGDLFIRIPRR
jgi:hypothetical protein